MKKTYTVIQTQTISKIFRINAENGEEAKRIVRNGDRWKEDERIVGPLDHHIIGQPQDYQVPYGPTLIDKVFEIKDRREAKRRVRVLAIDPNQTRAGKPAKSTVYTCREWLYAEEYRTVRIQEHVLLEKWREVRA